VVELDVRTSRREETIDVTERVQEVVARSGFAAGTCFIYTPHTTCALTVNEGYDPDVQSDFLAHLREVVPQRAGFRHAEGNSDAHIKAMLVGTSVTLPVSRGRLRLGRWQAIFMCEFDGPRERQLWLTVTGAGTESGAP
jgi:secondary thiamine-phosphate synthase enzyme